MQATNAHISLHTRGVTSFSWTDSYAGVTDEELEELLLQSRHTVTSLETELARRQTRNRVSAAQD